MSAPAMTGAECDWLGADVVTETCAPGRRGGRPAKDHSGRQRKVHCDACGFIAYASRGALQRSGFPSCGCGERMQLANLRDRAACEWETLERELRSYGVDAWNAAMRELGARGLVERKNLTGDRRSGAGQGRCQHEGSYCVRYVSGKYCREHAPDAGVRRRTEAGF